MSQRDFQLIQSKLHPPLIRQNLVVRPQLQQRLRNGVVGQLTLVTAPAGFGKTTLVTSCVRSCDMPIAWLSLGGEDNQPGHFLLYLVAALHNADNKIVPNFEQIVAEILQTPPELVLTTLINDIISSNSNILLIMDDYQFINTPAVHNHLNFLVEYLPGNLHLLIMSRSDPPLPLARLRARGQVVELRADDLRFTKSEAIQFLDEVMELHLIEKDVEILGKRTEGWIAGLQMAALSLRGRQDPHNFIQRFAGTDRFIMDFMIEEVLAHESQKVESFLLQTSFLTRFCSSLCDVVTNTSKSQEMLEYLEKSNLFVIPLDNERQWYRYHHLFADLLQARFNHSNSEQAAAFRSSAAMWCDRQELAYEAVDYALGAHNFTLAADLIDKYYPLLLSKGEVETAWNWLNALPEQMVRENVAIGVGFCWVLWLKGRMEEIGVHLAHIDQAFPIWAISKEKIVVDVISAHVMILKSIVARFNNDFNTAISLAEHALELAPKNLSDPVSAQLISLISLGMGSAYDGAGDIEKCVDAYIESIHASQLCGNATGVGITIRLTTGLRLLGRLREAASFCMEGLDYLKEHRMDRLPAAGVMHIALSEILIEQNELAAAEEHLSLGMELGKWSGRLDGVRNMAFSLSRLRLIHHDPNGAIKAIQQAQKALEGHQLPLAKAEILALEARFYVKEGNQKKAEMLINEALKIIGQDRGLTYEVVMLARARVLAADGESENILEFLSQSIERVMPRGLAGSSIERFILRSLIYFQKGKRGLAFEDLEKALALAEPQGFVRIFLDEGLVMQKMLMDWKMDSGSSLMRAYADNLLSHFENELRLHQKIEAEMNKNFGLIEALSQREVEVLQVMAFGKTNTEIAQQLFIAPGTVKAHTSSIFRKLDVSNRTEAVAKARQLGILS